MRYGRQESRGRGPAVQTFAGVRGRREQEASRRRTLLVASVCGSMRKDAVVLSFCGDGRGEGGGVVGRVLKEESSVICRVDS